MVGLGASLLCGFVYLGYIYWFSHRNKVPVEQKATWEEKWSATKAAGHDFRRTRP